MKCSYCEGKITVNDDYIKHDGERYCKKCYESSTVTEYSVGGNFLATDEDGVEEFCKDNPEIEED